jgi:hypothetical protein
MQYVSFELELVGEVQDGDEIYCEVVQFDQNKPFGLVLAEVYKTYNEVFWTIYGRDSEGLAHAVIDIPEGNKKLAEDLLLVFNSFVP